MPKLVCLSGMNKGEEFALNVGETTLGRSDKNPICIFDKKASRMHCKIEIHEDSKMFLVDLESTNGTRLNNNYVTTAMEIKVGDHIRIGQTIFLVDRSIEPTEDQNDEQQLLNLRNLEKYENLMQKTAFQVTKTTALRKLRMEHSGKDVGFLSFFQRNDNDDSELSES